MSKEEMNEIGAYKHWKSNVAVFGVIAAVYLTIYLGATLYLVLATDVRAFYILLGMGSLEFVIFGPFIIYYGAKMISLRKRISDYVKITVSITNADHALYSRREGGEYDCAAHCKETNTIVHFRVYMRYLPNGIDLAQGKLVEVWYNAKINDALFANKVS